MSLPWTLGHCDGGFGRLRHHLGGDERQKDQTLRYVCVFTLRFPCTPTHPRCMPARPSIDWILLPVCECRCLCLPHLLPSRIIIVAQHRVSQSNKGAAATRREEKKKYFFAFGLIGNGRAMVTRRIEFALAAAAACKDDDCVSVVCSLPVTFFSSWSFGRGVIMSFIKATMAAAMASFNQPSY